jgi:hypothetical protein
MFCVPERVFGGNEGGGSRFHVMRARTHFWRYRVRRVPFSCYAHPDAFSAVTRATCPVFMLCAPGRLFGGNEGDESRFNVMRARTRFRRYQGRRVTFSCYAHPYSFSAVARASGPFLMFYASGLIFGGNEGDGSRFHVMLARTRFRPYRGRRVPFSCFASPNSFSAVTRASGPIFLFCAPGLNFCCTEGVGSCFHVLPARTHFRR